MTNLEHLIENCLMDFEKDGKYEPFEIREHISKDINLEDAEITVKQCYEICQYVYYKWIKPLENEKKLEQNE